MPLSPVHSALKFSQVRGATSTRSSNVMRPTGVPPTLMSKKQRGRGDMSVGVRSRAQNFVFRCRFGERILTKYQYLSRTSETRLERSDDFER